MDSPDWSGNPFKMGFRCEAAGSDFKRLQRKAGQVLVVKHDVSLLIFRMV